MQNQDFKEYMVFYVANPNNYQPPKIKRLKGTTYWNLEKYHLAKALYYKNSPEMRVCHDVSAVCPELFKKANDFCESVYHHYGLLEKNENFNEEPDIYCVVTLGNDIVGTLGYSWSTLPILKTYFNLSEIENNAHELMRMSIKPGLGLKTEIMPKAIVRMRRQEHLWKNNKHVKEFGDFYHKSSSHTNEIGLLLFNGMLTFYRTLVNRCGYSKPPPVWISTHNIIEGFFDKILKKSIFKKYPKKINWKSIPKQSWNAYMTLEFNPYEIELNKIVPELFLRKEATREKVGQIAA